MRNVRDPERDHTAVYKVHLSSGCEISHKSTAPVVTAVQVLFSRGVLISLPLYVFLLKSLFLRYTLSKEKSTIDRFIAENGI